MIKKLGRPRKPPVQVVSWRPFSQEVRDLYIAKGGAAWLNATLRAEIAVLEKKDQCAKAAEGSVAQQGEK